MLNLVDEFLFDEQQRRSRLQFLGFVGTTFGTIGLITLWAIAIQGFNEIPNYTVNEQGIIQRIKEN